MFRSSRMRLVVPVALSTLLLGLAACGGDDDGDASDPASSSTTAAPVSPYAPPPSELVLKVLKVGTGATVKSGDSVTINYQGTNWRNGEIFDQSYGRGEATFGTNQVVPGFGSALVGQKVGSRVVVAIPPELGYGEGGQPDAGITGTDTLAFVIEIKATSGVAQCSAKPGRASNAVTVTGASGERVVPTFAKGLKAPGLQRTVLRRGAGPASKAMDTVEAVFSIFNGRTGKAVPGGNQSPVVITVGDQQVPEVFQAGLNCLKAGSRTVTVFPARVLLGAAGDPDAGVRANDTLVLVTDLVKLTPAPAPTPPPTPAEWTDAPEVTFNGSEPPTLTLPKA